MIVINSNIFDIAINTSTVSGNIASVAGYICSISIDMRCITSNVFSTITNLAT